MQHQNIVFHSVLKQVPWHRFDRLVHEYGSDKHVRTLATKSQLIALTYAQLSGAQSLREIEEALESHAGKLYHLGGARVSRSTLSDANAQRHGRYFQLVCASHRSSRTWPATQDQRSGASDHATGLRLRALSSCAQFSTGICGAKLHVVYVPMPTARSTPPHTGQLNDITAPKPFLSSPAPLTSSTSATTITAGGQALYRRCRIVTPLKSIPSSA